jgi:protein-tyrosine phosphatase
MPKDNRIVGLIDIHTHILPGMDDGAPDMVEARKLVHMAQTDGIRGIFLTPHYRGVYRKHTSLDLQNAFDAFCREMREAFPDMRFYLGCEIHYQSEVPELLCAGKLLPLADSQYILLEFQSNAFPSQMISAVHETVRSGFTPIIAHAERCATLRSDDALLSELLELGALIQLNADSVMGRLGFGIKHFCHKLLKARCVHFIASDAHNSLRRPPLLRECYWRVCKKYGEEYANELFFQNPQSVMDNLMI